MSNWLLSLSGVDRALLARTPRETAKFVGVGGAVLMTAVMAGLSAGYALHVSLGAPLPAVILLGALWGVGILNLDRWIIAATRRQGSFRKDVGMVLPRLFLAVIIGAVISEPLVLRIFNDEIESELRRMQSTAQAEFETRLLQDPRYEGLPDKEREIRDISTRLANGIPADAAVNDPEVVSLNAELARVNKELSAAEQAVACEAGGTCGSGTAGAGPVYEANLERRNRLRDEQSALMEQREDAVARAKDQAESAFTSTKQAEQERLEKLTAEVEQTKAARAAEVADNTRRVEDADGILARIEALHHLTQDSEAMKQARWALFLFILAIECMPVLVKLFMNLAKPGPYERLQEEEDAADLARAKLRLDTEAEEAQMHAQVALDAAETRARAELDAHLAAARALLDAQVEVVRAAAQTWRTDKLGLLKESPDIFFSAESTEVRADRHTDTVNGYFSPTPSQRVPAQTTPPLVPVPAEVPYTAEPFAAGRFPSAPTQAGFTPLTPYPAATSAPVPVDEPIGWSADDDEAYAQQVSRTAEATSYADPAQSLWGSPEPAAGSFDPVFDPLFDQEAPAAPKVSLVKQPPTG